MAVYYQVSIETTEKNNKGNKNKEYFELDKTTLSDFEERVLKPFLRKDDFQFDGYFLKYSEVRRIIIKETEKTVQELAQYENDNMPRGILMFVSPSDIVSYTKHTKDITAQIIDRVQSEISSEKSIGKKPLSQKATINDLNQVFIVHGRDDLAKTETARFIEKLGFEAIILHEQPSSGKTIIEKIEENTNVGFAIVLYTPCDIGGLNGNNELKARARQNVVFEHGFLIGKLGRQNVCALVKGNIDIPNDISGVVYVPFDTHGAWHLSVAKELRKAGYSVDMNKII